MAISFVASSSVANGLAQGTSATVPKPAGVVNGDRLIVTITIGNNGAIVAPANWIELSLATNFVGTTLQKRIYTKVANAEPASWVWTFSSAAYTGIAHATRGVGQLAVAAQDADGLALFSHTTPSLTAVNPSWLVSSFAGRNLLALGWSPQAGDSEREDRIGGLLILLNVNAMIADSNGQVGAGTYSRTATTLISVQALDALIVLGPLVIESSSIGSGEAFGVPKINQIIRVNQQIFSAEAFGIPLISRNLYPTDIDTLETFGIPQINLNFYPGSIASAEIFGMPVVMVGGVAIYPDSIVSTESFEVSHVIVPGMVAIYPFPIDLLLIDPLDFDPIVILLLLAEIFPASIDSLESVETPFVMKVANSSGPCC